MKKKLLAIIVMVAAAVLALTACGGSDSDKITLKYWYISDNDLTVQKLADKYMEDHPNITVEVYHMSDMSTDLSAAASAQNFPDIFEGTDCDTALTNMYWLDISEYWDNDPETKNLLLTVDEYGIGTYGTNARFAVPHQYQPVAFFIDRNVMKKLNLAMPNTDWTWSEMVNLVQQATGQFDDGIKYYGLGIYITLDSVYGIAAMPASAGKPIGEFGFDGVDFDLSYWATGEQEYANLMQSGYVAPIQGTIEMEDWYGDFDAWFGSTARVAVASEGLWTYQNLWGVESNQETWGTDWVAFPTPVVLPGEERNTIAYINPVGISTSCKHPEEAYDLMKFMTFGIDGWNARLDLYEDETITNDAGLPLKHLQMPAPITLDETVWARFQALYPQDDRKPYWDAYFESIKRPTPFGWLFTTGYWNFCAEYFNMVDGVGIHDLVRKQGKQAADYVEEATRMANYYHAEAMLSCFGPGKYNILSDEEIATYQAMIDAMTK